MAETARILVVEDEGTSLKYMAQVFRDLGHDVREASSGRAAIEVGCRFRPHVLVADWMLRNHFHGLDVCEALGQVNPGLRTILVTGFPSADLMEDAEKARVFRFLQKPFDLSDLEEAVQAALAEEAEPSVSPALGIVDLDRDGRIRFANERARHLFSYTNAGREAEHIRDVLPGDACSFLEGAVESWRAVRPLAPSSVKWMLRAGPLTEDGSRLLLLRNRRDHIVGQSQMVEALLGVEQERSLRWPHRGAVLVVDADRAIRRTCVRLLRNAGATAYGVADRDEMLPFLQQDTGIHFVVLDYGSGAATLAPLVERARREHPEVRIVGTAAENREAEFRSLGVERFLQKPWSLRALIQALG